MKIFGYTIHKGDCPEIIRIKREIIYRTDSDHRSDSQRMIDLGHKKNCVRVKYPNSLHPCNCGLE